jgi:uncharacterized protein with von Willebrand factor type A (vWA) domain
VARDPLDRLFSFVSLLRANGLTISPAEASDALRAIALAPDVLTQRETLQAALAGALIKRSVDRPHFLTLFAAYFGPEEDGLASNEHGHTHDHGDGLVAGIDLVAEPGRFADAGPPRHEHGRRIDLRRYFGDAGPGERGHDHHGDRMRLTWFGKDLLFDRAGGPPPSAAEWDGAFSLHRVRTAGRPGALRTFDGRVELPSEVVLRGQGVTGGEERQSDLLAWAEEVARSGIPKHRSPLPRSRASEADLELPDLAWDALTAADLVMLERAIGRLGRRLGGAPGHRRPGRHGRLDARATMRRAAATGGIPFRPHLRERADDRPRLIVLCDASLSVRGAARFLLHVSRAAQRQSGRVRTFAFVRDVAEVTHALQRDVQTALAAIFDGQLLDTSEASDGGGALGTFLRRHGGLLTSRTTLLILGDGRNNGRDPNIDALAELRRRCRRLIWLSPEERGSWRLAGCDLPRYARHCDVLEPVRTPAQLERFVARIAT